MSYNSVVAADSPVAWWRLDENSGATSVADSSGNNITGTVTQTVTFGVGGQPAGMTGTVSSWASDASQNISFSSYQPSFTNGSWELWYNQNGTNAGTNPRVVGDNNNNAVDGFDFLLQGKTTPSFSTGNGTTNAVITASSGLGSGWNHIVITYDGAHLNMYVNASSAASAVALTGTIGPHGTNFVRIGGNFPWESHDPFSGLLCQVAFYSTALSTTQITNHYNAGITPGGGANLTVDAVTLAAPLLTPMVGPDPFPAPGVALAAPAVSLAFGAASIPLPVATVTLTAPPLAASGGQPSALPLDPDVAGGFFQSQQSPQGPPLGWGYIR